MVQRLVQDSRRGVCHAGNSQHAHFAVPRRDDLRHRGHAHQVRADRAQIAYLGGRFVTRSRDRRVHALVNSHSQAVAFPDGHFAKPPVVRRGHVRKTQPKALVVRSGERIHALQIDVVLDNHQPPLPELVLDSARRIRQDHGLYAHAREHSYRKRHLFHGITFIKMYAALHPGDGDGAHFADHQPARVPDGGGLWKVRNFRVRNLYSAGKFVRERPEAGAQHQRDFRPERCLRKNEIGGEPRAFEFTAERLGFRRGRCVFTGNACFHWRSFALFFRPHVNIPTMEADIKLAMVPASMARMPNLASWPRCSGASAPMPPICMPMELKLANPQSANVAIVKVRGSSVLLIAPSCWNATSSLITMRVPRRLPMAPHSFHGTPITHATGAKSQPKTCCKLDGNHAR